jgi:hypothetical protein
LADPDRTALADAASTGSGHWAEFYLLPVMDSFQMSSKLIQTLMQQASGMLRPLAPAETEAALAGLGADCLAPLYQAFNGGYFFDRALEVFPIGTSHYTEIRQWNDAAGWRKDFDQDLNGIVFFAHDLFCFQYGVLAGAVVRLNYETGEVESLAPDLQAFLELFLGDCDYYSGFSLLEDWEEENGPLPMGQRLFAKKPFVLGGDWEVCNLWASAPLPVLSFRAFIAKHIKGKPDGTKVSINLPDGKKLKGVIQR